MRTVRGDHTRRAPYAPSFSIVCAYTATSRAVEKSPACPVTPPRPEGVGVVHHPVDGVRALRAERGGHRDRLHQRDGGIVLRDCIPSGPKTRRARNWSTGTSARRRTTSAMVIIPKSLYSIFSPGL
jgi:hypothetical protein